MKNTKQKLPQNEWESKAIMKKRKYHLLEQNQNSKISSKDSLGLQFQAESTVDCAL